MDSRSNDNYAELPSVETPEDVAVLYSWANLHGAKYRDFSASRREYRAQLRHRAAEQARETELRAQAEAEDAAAEAAEDVRQAEAEARAAVSQVRTAGSQARAAGAPSAARAEALRDAEVAAQRASAERIEAGRRAEAAAQAQAQARREEREIAEAHISARRQEALYLESNERQQHFQRHQAADATAEVPGSISDPYTPQSRQPLPPVDPHAATEVPVEMRPQRMRAERAAAAQPAAYQPDDPWRNAPEPSQYVPGGAARAVSEPPPSPITPPLRRPQGYRPDDASGVRQIYRPELDPPKRRKAGDRARGGEPQRPLPASLPVPPYATRETTLPQVGRPPAHQAPLAQASNGRERPASPPAARAWTAAPSLAPHVAPPSPAQAAGQIGASAARRPETPAAERHAPFLERRRAPEEILAGETDLAGETADPAPRRRRQDQPGYRVTDSDRAIAAYRREQGQVHAAPALTPQAAKEGDLRRDAAAARQAEPVLPAWIHEQPQETDEEYHERPLQQAQGQPQEQPFGQADERAHEQPRERAPERLRERPRERPQDRSASGIHELRSGDRSGAQELSSETLQRSRERVASRWYALKGVFEPGQERAEPQPARQRETRTPVLAVFSFAGGVGKTSLVATLGRSLSSLGEKVLLTDTTSHGLLPFYFGASELRESTVRTFSPPSGSTDAPIYLVNYAVDQSGGDEAAQEAAIDGITENGRGAHRILLDLTSSTAWLIRRVAHMAPTVLVPLAPDMNSVISLQPIERFLNGIDGPDGTPVKVFYVLNQFDAGLPLHLDVREVLRRQLGERLLPTLIRRAPAVSEALAEGMTIIDYAADAPVAEDYMNVANWLRTVSAPATAGFRNVRWSER